MLIRRGARGERVREIQIQLNKIGYGPLDEDGIYGRGSESAIRLFQKGEGLGADGIVGPKTLAALNGEPAANTGDEPTIIKVLRSKGYAVHEDGQCNIIGVRSSNNQANSFDDAIHLVWKSNGWQHNQYPCTCDPGNYWLESPMRVEGTAIMVPGQYVNAYCWGLHRGQYETLVQRGPGDPVKVYRDANKDEVLDMDPSTIELGHGLNLHHAGTDSTNVEKWSAGCQVFKRLADWKDSVRIWKSTQADLFTYTLILEDDLP